MKDLFNMHFFSQLVKYAFGGVTVLISAILSYTFFKSIQPPGMDVFPFVALALTEGGLAAWIFVFSGQRHHPIKGFVAIAMVAACLLTTVVITFAELIQLFNDHTLVDNATVKNGTLILLEVMLFIHLLAVVSDFMVDRITVLLKEVKAMPQASTEQTYLPSTSVQAIPQASSNGHNADVDHVAFLESQSSQN